MDDNKDRRRSPRLYVTLPATYKVLPAKVLDMPKELAEVYERVHPNSENAGETLQGMVRDLSANGAFITGPTVPLLSRILVTFPLPGMANIEAIGWVLWLRHTDCSVEKMVPGRSDPAKVTLSMGFGILFEAIPSPARRHIHRLARMNSSLSKLDTLNLFSSRMEDTGEFLADEDLEEVPDVGGDSEHGVSPKKVEVEEVQESGKESTDTGESIQNVDAVAPANAEPDGNEVGVAGSRVDEVKSEASPKNSKKRVPKKTEEIEAIEEIEEIEEFEEIGEIQEVESSKDEVKNNDSRQVSGEIGSSGALNETGGSPGEKA